MGGLPQPCLSPTLTQTASETVSGLSWICLHPFFSLGVSVAALPSLADSASWRIAFFSGGGAEPTVPLRRSGPLTSTFALVFYVE